MSASASLFVWLALSKENKVLPRAQIEFFENLIALGAHDRLALELAKLPTELSSGLFSKLCIESCLFISGQTQKVFDAIGEWPEMPYAASEFERSLWAERVYFKGLCAHRLGNVDMRRKAWDEVKLTIGQTKATHLEFYIQIEEGSMLMNRGMFESTCAMVIDALKKADLLGVYYESRAHGILGTSYQRLGDFKNAEKEFSREALAIRQVPSEALKLANQCRKIELMLEQEDYNNVSRPLETALEQAHVSPNSLALLLKYKLRLMLMRGTVDETFKSFDTLHSHLKTYSISRSFISDLEESCEIALLRNDVETALRELEAVCWSAVSEGNRSLECLVRLYLSCVQNRKGQTRAAVDSAMSALQIAESQKFGSLALRALTQLCVLHYALSEKNLVKTYFVRAKTLAAKLRMHASEACLNYFSHLATNPHSPVSRVLTSLKGGQVGRELEYSLTLYGLKTPHSFELVVDGASHRLTEFECRRWLATTPGTYWAEDEQLLFRNEPNKEFKPIDLSDKKIFCRAILMCLSSKSNILSSDFHALESVVPYRSDKHGTKVRQLVFRIKQALHDVGFDLEFERQEGSYRVVRPDDFFQIRSKVG